LPGLAPGFLLYNGGMKYKVGDTIEITLTLDVVEEPGPGERTRHIEEFYAALEKLGREFGLSLRGPKPWDAQINETEVDWSLP
jgi:hypothetical protein